MRRKLGCAIMMLPTEKFKEWVLNLYIGHDSQAKEKWAQTLNRLSNPEIENIKNSLSDVTLEKFQGDSSLYMLLSREDPKTIHHILENNKIQMTKIELISRGIDEKYWPDNLHQEFDEFFMPILINHLYMAS